MNFAIGAILKNEDIYLLEWLAFHRVVGFSRFFLADNASTDLTRKLLDILQRSEPITLIDYPDQTGARPQLGAYQDLVRHCGDDVDAIAFIDADEFILPMDGATSVVPWLSGLFARQDVGGVALNWACHGSGGYRFWSDSLTIERFRRRAPQRFPVNHHYKVVVRPRAVARWDSPHHAQLAQGGYVDALGRELAYRDGFRNSLARDVVWAGARINHYVVRSFEEFVLRKSPKGSASKAGRTKHRRYFELHDRNDARCNAMQAFVPAVKEEMRRLLDLAMPVLRADDCGAAAGGGPLWSNWSAWAQAGFPRRARARGDGDRQVAHGA